MSATTGKSDECARFLPKWVLKEDVEVLCKEGEINYSGVVECAHALRKSDIDVVTELCRNAPSAAPTGCFSASIRMGEVSNSDNKIGGKQHYLIDWWSLLLGLFRLTSIAALE